jgi:photosystem II stability/assembly factor-like uncharacterized protein
MPTIYKQTIKASRKVAETQRIAKKILMTKRFTLLYLLIAFSPHCLIHAQTPGSWQTLPNAPITSRHNDAYFVNPNLGWIVSGAAQIYKTTDGGASWQLQFSNVATHLRSVGFIDSLRGWAGNVGLGEFSTTDSTVLYETADGGQSWLPMETFVGPKPRGLCGMHVVNDTVICAVGRVRGPSFFVRTIDAGKTWVSKDMSAYAAGLIDVYFFHPDTGFAVGLTNVTHDQSHGVVLSTTDGGLTWEKRYTTPRSGEWCWKLSFPSRRVGYASLQRNSLTPIYFLKTTDGGKTWQDKLFSASYYFVQGIGFVNELEGWIGGNSSLPTYTTTDGGETWQSAGFGSRVNRFRFLNDSLGYAVGQTVYKFTRSTQVSIETKEDFVPQAFVLYQNYPNPFQGSTAIRFRSPANMPARIMIFDIQGRRVHELAAQRTASSEQVLQWDSTNDDDKPVSAGIYFITLQAGRIRQTRKMIVLPR